MPLAVEIIGTGETYTTIQAWEDALAADMQHTGQCKAEVLAKVSFDGVTYTSSNYPLLTSIDGAEHNGTANEVSAAGNARIESTAAGLVTCADPYVRVSWLEFKGPGATAGVCILFTGGTTSEARFHHNVVHNNQAGSASTDRGVRFRTESAAWLCYRNIIYGFDGNGLMAESGTASAAFLLNSIYETNASNTAGDGGYDCTDTDPQFKSNAIFDNLQKDIDSNNGTLSNNATSDATATEGTNNLINQTTADQFVNATTTWANTNLLLKVGADLIDAVETTFSTATYPEIDESIDARGVSVTGTWDIGASEYIEPVDNVTADDSDHSHTADQPAIAQVHAIGAADSDHGHTADQPAITQEYGVEAADSDHSHTVDQPTITQVHVLVANDSDHSHTADQPDVIQAHSIAGEDSAHGHAADEPTVDQDGSLSVQDSDHSHAADQPALTQVHSVIVQDSDHSHTADQPELTQAYNIDAQDSTHGQTVDPAILSQAVVLVAVDSAHGQTAEVVTISQAIELVAGDSDHSHTADQSAVTQSINLSCADTAHGQSADQPTITEQFQPISLTAQDSVHNQRASTVRLFQPGFTNTKIKGITSQYSIEVLTPEYRIGLI